MTHIFDTEMAKEVGIEAAIIYQNICFWVDKNRANNQNFINGYFWTYNTYNAWQELFPYMKLNTIKRAIKVLKEAGFIVVEKGLNESNKWDKTNYYRHTNKVITDSKEKSPSEQYENNYVYSTDNKQHIINSYNKTHNEFDTPNKQIKDSVSPKDVKEQIGFTPKQQLEDIETSNKDIESPKDILSKEDSICVPQSQNEPQNTSTLADIPPRAKKSKKGAILCDSSHKEIDYKLFSKLVKDELIKNGLKKFISKVRETEDNLEAYELLEDKSLDSVKKIKSSYVEYVSLLVGTSEEQYIQQIGKYLLESDSHSEDDYFVFG